MNDAEEREFSFTLAKMYEIPKVEALLKFIAGHLKDDVEIIHVGNSFKMFRVVFKVKR